MNKYDFLLNEIALRLGCPKTYLYPVETLASRRATILVSLLPALERLQATLAPFYLGETPLAAAAQIN